MLTQGDIEYLRLFGRSFKLGCGFMHILRSYERLIFPSTPSPAGMAKLEQLKDAMRQLSELVEPDRERNELSWSMRWLTGIGHPETNPPTLTLFAVYWMNNYIAVAKSLKDIRPN